MSPLTVLLDAVRDAGTVRDDVGAEDVLRSRSVACLAGDSGSGSPALERQDLALGPHAELRLGLRSHAVEQVLKEACEQAERVGQQRFVS